MTKKNIKSEKIEPKKFRYNCCPDFDDDCYHIDNVIGCFIGKGKGKGKEQETCGIAEGYCPLIHNEN